MVKISQVVFKLIVYLFLKKDFSKVPSWLKIDKTFTPDFVVEDPRK